jgi:hypothetical protein
MKVGVLRFIDCYHVLLIHYVHISFVPVEIGRAYGPKFCDSDQDSDTASALQVQLAAELLSDWSC